MLRLDPFMSYLSIPNNLFPLSSRAYMHSDNGYLNHYICLFHSVRKGTEPPFELQRTKNWGFSYVLSGKGKLEYHDGSSYALSSGNFFQIQPDGFQALRVDNSETWRECSIAIHSDTVALLKAIHGIRSLDRVYPIGIQQPIIQRYLDCYQLITQKQTPKPSQVSHTILGCLSLIYQAIDQLEQQSENDFLSQAQLLLCEHIQERYPLALVAAKMGMNYHAFRRQFKLQSGLSPGDWLIQQRIHQAQTLLINNSIETCSALLGYADRFTFSRQFKKVTGHAPRAYQNMLHAR